MYRPALLASVLLLVSCASTPADNDSTTSVFRGRVVIQFEQQEFFECGDTGKVLTISNPEKFRKAGEQVHSDDIYYKVEGVIREPGEAGSVGITDGVLVATKVEALTGARLACPSAMQAR